MNAPVHAPLCQRALAEQAAVAMATTPVPSPCVNICRIAADTGLCTGCQRTLDEIATWSRLDDPAKRAVWAALPERAGP
jgi:uncharacterized protein